MSVKSTASSTVLHTRRIGVTRSLDRMVPGRKTGLFRGIGYTVSRMYGDPRQPGGAPFAGIPGSDGTTPATGSTSVQIVPDQSQYPRDRRRAVSYFIEARRAANSELLRSVDREVFLAELEAGTEPSRELLVAVVRAFARAALRLPQARTREGWQEVMSRLRTMLGTAMELGYNEVRPIAPGLEPLPRIPEVPPVPAWAILAYEQRRPTAAELEANLAYWKGLPVRLVETVIRAHLNARYRSPDGATPEGRSRIIGDVRDAIWDAVLDAVKRYPCPAPAPTPPARKPGPKRPPAR
jgi:hypothetical protein